MKKYLFLAGLLGLILACNLPMPTVAPVTPVTSTGGQNSNPPTQAHLEITPEMASTAQPAVGTGTLPLSIVSPLDGAIVNTSQLEIVGTAPAGAVVSINDDILIVDGSGQFKDTVTLEEGPNVFEIIASDVNGNEAYLLLSVFYEP